MVFLPFAAPRIGVFMDAGGSAPKVSTLGDAGAVAEAKKKTSGAGQPDSIKCRVSDSLMLKRSKFD